VIAYPGFETSIDFPEIIEPDEESYTITFSTSMPSHIYTFNNVTRTLTILKTNKIANREYDAKITLTDGNSNPLQNIYGF